MWVGTWVTLVSVEVTLAGGVATEVEIDTVGEAWDEVKVDCASHSAWNYVGDLVRLR